MKHFYIYFCFFAIQLYAQQTNVTKNIIDKKYEVKIAPIDLLSGYYITSSFEYFKNKDFSYGLWSQFSLDQEKHMKTMLKN